MKVELALDKIIVELISFSPQTYIEFRIYLRPVFTYYGDELTTLGKVFEMFELTVALKTLGESQVNSYMRCRQWIRLHVLNQ